MQGHQDPDEISVMLGVIEMKGLSFAIGENMVPG
jgi:hypothetical protein